MQVHNISKCESHDANNVCGTKYKDNTFNNKFVDQTLNSFHKLSNDEALSKFSDLKPKSIRLFHNNAIYLNNAHHLFFF